jgi:hypothetical protein
MIFLLETFIILAILSLNFVTIMRVKRPISLILSVTITGLAMVLLCVINIADPQILKSLIFAIIIYSAATIALVFAANSDQETPNIFKNKFRSGLIFLFILVISSGIFYVGQEMKNNFVPKNDNRLERIMGIVDSVRIIEENPDRKNLTDNVFLKNSTYAILLIVGAMMLIPLVIRSRIRHPESISR